LLHFDGDKFTHTSTAEVCTRCVPGVYQNIPADLAKVVSAWAELSEDAKQRIVEIIERGA
jgi:hypothetical protein